MGGVVLFLVFANEMLIPNHLVWFAFSQQNTDFPLQHFDVNAGDTHGTLALVFSPQDAVSIASVQGHQTDSLLRHCLPEGLSKKKFINMVGIHVTFT